MKKRFFFSGIFYKDFSLSALNLNCAKLIFSDESRFSSTLNFNAGHLGGKKGYSERLKFGSAANEITKSKFVTCIDLTKAMSALNDQLYHFSKNDLNQNSSKIQNFIDI